MLPCGLLCLRGDKHTLSPPRPSPAPVWSSIIISSSGDGPARGGPGWPHLVSGQAGPELGRGGGRIDTGREGVAVEAAAEVVGAPLHCDEADARVFERGEAVGRAALERLVGAPAALDVHDGKHAAFLRERHARAGDEVGPGGI